MELYVDICKQLRSFELKAAFTARDEVFALLGGSGCGKSMTLKCIAGIEQPDQGYIRLGDRVLFDSVHGINLRPQERRVGYLFQNYALFPNMTIAENIAFAARGNPTEKKRCVQDNLRRFALTELADDYPARLSGGQQQRAAFARILASGAELLMLDEPFSALDSYLKWQIEQELMKVLQDYGGSALFVSHDRGEVYRLCDRCAVMHDGQIEAVDTKQELFANPQTLAGTLLTGCKNVSAAHSVGTHQLQAVDWGLQLHTAVPVPVSLRYIGFRAHFFERMDGPGENTFLAEVVQVIEDTFSFLIMVRPQGTDARPLRWEVDKEQWQAMKGQVFWLHMPEDKLILMER